MGRKIPALMSMLIHPKRGRRYDFTTRIKKEVIRRQKGKCALCRGHLNRWETDFDHKNGDSSDNKPSNCKLHTQDAIEKSMRKKPAKDKIN